MYERERERERERGRDRETERENREIERDKESYVGIPKAFLHLLVISFTILSTFLAKK